MSSKFEVSLLAWSDDGEAVRLVGRTRDPEAVALVREQLRREVSGSEGPASATPAAGRLRLVDDEVSET